MVRKISDVNIFNNRMVFMIIAFTCLNARAFDSATVKKIATVNTSEIRLRDVVDFASPESTSVIGDLVLDQSPNAGQSIKWTTADFVNKLKPYQNDLRTIHFILPKEIEIQRADNRLSESTLKVAMLIELKAVAPQGWRTELKDLQPLHLPELSETAKWKVVPLQRRPKGPFQFEVIIEDQAQFLQNLWVNGHMEYQAQVATLKNPVKMLTKIKSTDVSWEERNVTYLSELPATAADLLTSVARTGMYSGSQVTMGSLDKELALKFGDEVEVKTGNEDFFVTTRGVAQQNGYLGDDVKIRTVGSQKTLTGKLVAKGLVQLID